MLIFARRCSTSLKHNFYDSFLYVLNSQHIEQWQIIWQVQEISLIFVVFIKITAMKSSAYFNKQDTKIPLLYTLQY